MAKFFRAEYRAEGDGSIYVKKTSELGKLLHLVARPIPYVQKKPPVADLRLKAETVTLLYTVKEKTTEVPNQKIPLIAEQMDVIFRRTLIAEVRGIHHLLAGDYGPHVADVLRRRDISEEDIDFQTARKIYRDYLEKTERENRNFFSRLVT